MKKSSLNLILNLLVFLCQSLVCVNSQSDSCRNHLNLNDMVKFETTFMSCQSVWDKEGFILRYEKVKSSRWSFILSAPNKGGYVAMGFSNQMIGSSAMVGWPESGSTGKMKQYFLGDKSIPGVVPDKGDLKVVVNSSVVFIHSSRIYLAFQLSDSSAAPPNELILAYGGFQPRSGEVQGKYQLQNHINKIATRLNYASGQVQVQQSPYAQLRKDHGILNILAWGVLLPLGTLTARYFRRWDPIWFYSHVAIQTLAFILGLVGIILGMVLQGLLNLPPHTITHHKAIGLTVLVLSSLQVTALLLRPNKGSKPRKYWNWYHHFAGRLLIILALANIFYGITLAPEGLTWTLSYGSILALITLAAIYLEIKLRTEDSPP